MKKKTNFEVMLLSSHHLQHGCLLLQNHHCRCKHKKKHKFLRNGEERPSLTTTSNMATLEFNTNIANESI